ncbi:unnamed protein product [Adineta steineri]|uniref:Uncharacterized protein n=3 Tax=Adineta steineri TaxID=433720 RepID=A0A814X7J9_9BILA|nr:unnamed protein product [Adineta steineri]
MLLKTYEIKILTQHIHPAVLKHEYNPHNVWDFDKQWQTKFCSCQPTGRCIFACFCSCCMGNKLAKYMGEKGIIGCFPCSLPYLRTKLRTARRIEGSCCEDYWASNCCMACTATQLANELETQGLWDVSKTNKSKHVRIDHSNQYND